MSQRSAIAATAARRPESTAARGDLAIIAAGTTLSLTWAAILLWGAGTDSDGTELALRMTARASFVWFMLAFVAAPLHQLRPSRAHHLAAAPSARARRDLRAQHGDPRRLHPAALRPARAGSAADGDRRRLLHRHPRPAAGRGADGDVARRAEGTPGARRLAASPHHRNLGGVGDLLPVPGGQRRPQDHQPSVPRVLRVHRRPAGRRRAAGAAARRRGAL